jgi:hypothetical protein
MAELILRMADGTHIAVPASLDSITTYVILEQERWFEKETAFLSGFLIAMRLQPMRRGAHAILPCPSALRR